MSTSEEPPAAAVTTRSCSPRTDADAGRPPSQVDDASLTLVFDETIHGTALVRSEPVACREERAIVVVAESLTGADPSIAIAIEESSDEISWHAGDETPSMTVSRSKTPSTLAIRRRGANPSAEFWRLRCALWNSGGSARVRIWATGGTEGRQ